MKYVVYVVGALVALVVILFMLDLLSISVAERRIKQARFFLETPNPDEASKLAARAMRKLNQYPTVQKGRRAATLEAGEEVLLEGLTGMFTEQYNRDMRFRPGPQWDICESRARIKDPALCIEAAGVATSRAAHRYIASEQIDEATRVIQECVDHEARPEVAALCRERAGQWLADEAAALVEKGNAPPAAEILRQCLKNPDHWDPAQACIDDWHVTVRRARNALIPKFKSCEAIQYYLDMPDGMAAEDRKEAEEELAELRSTTALIETLFHYDVVEFKPANRYWGLGEESTKHHLTQVLTPAGYTIQWLEEEHPKGAWDKCDPAYTGAIVTHEILARRVQAFKKECITVRVQPEITLYEGKSKRVHLKEKADGRLPKGLFQDEEFFLDECGRSRDMSWQDSHARMREWDIESIKETPES